MKTKCAGLMGRVFGHKWEPYLIFKDKLLVLPGMTDEEAFSGTEGLPIHCGFICQRCGAVTGEKK